MRRDEKCAQCSLAGPWCLDRAPPTGVWRHLKCFRGCRDLAPMEERGRGMCSRGHHSLLMQHSNSRAHSASRNAGADSTAHTRAV